MIKGKSEVQKQKKDVLFCNKNYSRLISGKKMHVKGEREYSAEIFLGAVDVERMVFNGLLNYCMSLCSLYLYI